MNFELTTVLIVTGLFTAMLACQELGRRLAHRHRRLSPDHELPTSGAAEGAVFGLLGLFLAFTFSGAANRFQDRRDLIIEEASAIRTAWLRIDLLPEPSRPAVRDLFRSYVDARLDAVQKFPDMKAVQAARDSARDRQLRIWSTTVAAAASSNTPYAVLLNALNDMFEVAARRIAATRFHIPLVVFVILAMLSLVGSLFAGYGLAARGSRSVLHSVGFAAVMTVAIYVIIDLEYPRLGLIRVDSVDQLMVEVRQSME